MSDLVRQDQEIVSLNAEDLDVIELERRLELATAAIADCIDFSCYDYTRVPVQPVDTTPAQPQPGQITAPTQPSN